MIPSISLNTDSLGLGAFASSGASVITGGAGTAECGSKPPVFARKERKEAYENCLAQVNQARILGSQAALAQAQQGGGSSAMFKNTTPDGEPNYTTYAIIAAIIIILIIIFKK
jgi:hypothetical protein